MKLNKKIAISESGFLFDSSSGDSYSLNPTAVEILDLIKKNTEKEKMKKILLEKYDVTLPVLEKYLDEFITTLKNLKVVQE